MVRWMHDKVLALLVLATGSDGKVLATGSDGKVDAR